MPSCGMVSCRGIGRGSVSPSANCPQGLGRDDSGARSGALPDLRGHRVVLTMGVCRLPHSPLARRPWIVCFKRMQPRPSNGARRESSDLRQSVGYDAKEENGQPRSVWHQYPLKPRTEPARIVGNFPERLPKPPTEAAGHTKLGFPFSWTYDEHVMQTNRVAVIFDANGGSTRPCVGFTELPRLVSEPPF